MLIAKTSILPPAQKELWPALVPSVDLGMVLYGGTALALRLGHRISVDFDFFTELPLDKKVVRERFSFMKKATVVQDEENTLTVLVENAEKNSSSVKVSFFGGIHLGRVGEPDLTDDGVLAVASMRDLMATKAAVITQRVEAKDYIDLAAMLQAGENLSEGLAGARALYGEQFSPFESLRAMTYFEGGDLHSLTEEVKQTLTKACAAVARLPHVPVLSATLSSEHLAEAPEEKDEEGPHHC